MTTVVGFKLVNDYSELTKGFDSIHGEYTQMSEENKKAASDTKKVFKAVGDEAKKFGKDVKNIPPIIPPPGENGKKQLSLIQQLKKEIRELTSIAGDSTKSFREQSLAIQEAADKKAQIRDLQDAVNALDPDTKAAAFTNLASTAVGAGQGIAGAMTLAGVNSEKYEKVLIRLAAIDAIGAGLKSLGNLKDEWNKAKIAIDSYLLKLEAKVAAQTVGVAVENTDTAAKEVNTVVTNTQTKAVGVATIAQRAWNLAMSLNPIGIIIAALVALTGIISIYISNTQAAADAERTRSQAADGTIIANEELRKSYNELLVIQKKIIVDLKVARGEISQLNGTIEKINIDKFEAIRAAQQEITAATQETDTWYNRTALSLIKLTGIVEENATVSIFANEKIKKQREEMLKAELEAAKKIAEAKAENAVKEAQAVKELQVEILKTEKLNIDIAGQARLDALEFWQKKEGELQESFDRRKSLARQAIELDMLDKSIEQQKRIASTEAALAKEKIGETAETAQQIQVIEEQFQQKLIALDGESAHQRSVILARSASERIKITTDLFKAISALHGEFDKQEEARNKLSPEEKAKDDLEKNLDQIAKLKTRALQNARDLDAQQKAETEANLRGLVSQAYANYYAELTRLRLEQNKKDAEIEKQSFVERLKRLEASQQITLNDVELANKRQGESEEAFEKRKNQAKLQINLDYAEAKLQLLQDQGLAESAAEISNLQVLIKNLRAEISKGTEDNKKSPSIREFLKSLLGVTDEQIEAVISELDAINQITGVLLDSKSKQLDMEKQINDEQIALRDNNLTELERQLDQELRLHEQGFASNVDAIRDKIKVEKQAREQALEDQKKIAEQSKKLAKEQLILETVQQASSLVSAGAKLYQVLAPLGPPGILLATITSAAMLGAFIRAKKQAFAAANEGFYEGGYTGDGDKRKEAGVVHGKEFVTTAEDTKQNRTLLEGIHQKNKGMILEGVVNLLRGTGVKLNRAVPGELQNRKANLRAEELMVLANVDNSKLEDRIQSMQESLDAYIKYEKEKPEIIPLGNGSYMEKRGSSSRIVKT